MAQAQMCVIDSQYEMNLKGKFCQFALMERMAKAKASEESNERANPKKNAEAKAKSEMITLESRRLNDVHMTIVISYYYL